MMLLSELTAFCTILPEAVDKFAAFGEIVRNCSVFDAVRDKHAYLESVIKREKLQSTGIGHCVAIAHGKVPHLEQTHIALGISPDGIVFDDIFPEPVRLVFLIASCPTKQSEYVKALASLLSWMHDEKMRTSLMRQDFSDPAVGRFLEMMKEQSFHPAEVR